MALTGEEILDGKTEDEDQEQEVDETPETPEGEEEEQEETPEEEEKEEEEEEEKEEEEPEKEEEPERDLGTVSLKTLQEEYPGIFKKYPQLRRNLVAGHAVFSLYSSVEEMEKVAADTETYQMFDRSISEGDPTLVLSSLKRYDEKALGKFVENFGPTVNEMSPELFKKHIAHPIIANFLQECILEGQKLGNKDIHYGARHLAKMLYGTRDGSVPEVPKLIRKRELDPEKVQLEREKMEFANAKLTDFQNGVWARAKDMFLPEIQRAIDPKNELNDFVRNALVDRVAQDIGLELAQDRLYSENINNHWRAAQRNGFRPETRARVISAFLARARQALRRIAPARLEEAIGRTPQSKKKKVESITRKAQLQGSAPGGKRGGRVDSSKIDWTKTTSEDVLNDRITYLK